MVVLFSSSLSAVEKQRQYHDHEETAEMVAARIDRDVVSEKLQGILLNVCEIFELCLMGRFFQFWRKAFQAPCVCEVDLKN